MYVATRTLLSCVISPKPLVDRALGGFFKPEELTCIRSWLFLKMRDPLEGVGVQLSGGACA